jgi:TRAP-type C4-dicarboxylate transport system permease small subunit
MTAPSRAGPLLDATARATLWTAGLALVVMAAVEFWQVFARYVLNDSPSWTEPVALVAMKTVMMMGAAAGVRQEAHFGFFVAVEAAPPAARRAILAFGRAVVFAIGAMLAYWGSVLAADGWDVPMAGIALPEGAAFVPIAAGGALIALFAAAALAGRAAARAVEG